MNTQDPTPNLVVVNGRPMAKSTDVAEYFGKQHKNVLRDISNLQEHLGEFGRLNFEPTSYIDTFNREQPIVEMTKDGFTFLAMGFTGEKAYQFKIAYINEFNRMEAALRGQVNPARPSNRKFGHTEDGCRVTLRSDVILENSIGEHVPCVIDTGDLAFLSDRAHYPLVRRIRELLCSHKMFSYHFIEGREVFGRGRERTIFFMSRDGFTMLTANWRFRRDSGVKSAVYEAFNLMEKEIWERDFRLALGQKPDLRVVEGGES
jgi:Rha family phage regulatory protein